MIEAQHGAQYGYRLLRPSVLVAGVVNLKPFAIGRLRRGKDFTKQSVVCGPGVNKRHKFVTKL
jgi:hypothetical protein